MLSVSKEYLQSIVSDTREMPYRVTLAGSLVLDKTKIPSMSIDENIGGNEGVALGTANSATLKFTLKNAAAVDYDGMMVEPESGLVLPDKTAEWLPLGRFWVTDFSTSNDFKTVEFTCADGMYHMTSEYVSALTYPAHIRDVAHEIVEQSGVEFVEPTEWPEIYVRRKPEGLTHREAIGHVAGCCGCNARFNRYGKLEFAWYKDSGITISRRTQYLDGLTKLNFKPLEVNFEVTGQTETYTVKIISDGNGGVSATPGNGVLEDETVVLSVNPFGGYELATIYAETDHGEEVILYQRAEGGYTFVQPDDNVTVIASFREKDATAFKVTARAYDGGTLEIEKSDNELGENYFNVGDKVTISIYPDEGKQIQEIATTPKKLTYYKSGSKYSFFMPKSDVTFNVYFKDEEDVAPPTTPYSWLQIPASPPTQKPYWAMYYRDDPNLPTCQKYYLIWFDSWDAFGHTNVPEINRMKFTVEFNGYYYCGSRNNGHGNHEWDDSTWSGNGDESSRIVWESHIGYMWSGADDKRIEGQYCLIASNVNLYASHFGGATVFEANENEITPMQTGYILDGVDIRERDSLSYWRCPDTFSTPLPAQNWMILMPGSGLYMMLGGNGKYQTALSSYPQTMIAFFYDSIDIQRILSVVDDSLNSESFYIASVTNGQWAYLRNKDVDWDDIHTLPTGAVIGFRDPLVSTEPKYIYSDGNNYQFSGILATNSNLYVDGKVFMYNNACRVCDCVSETAIKTFSLRRSIVSDGIEINLTDISVTADNGMLVINSPRITASHTDDEIVLTIDTSPTETEKVTLTYTNPMIYEKMVEPISGQVSGVTYTPAKVKFRGNPALQAGDIVKAPDKDGAYHNILIIQQTMTFGGGMNGEISCPGKTEKTKSFSAISPVTTQIKKEVQKSNAELEKRLASNNALVFNSMYKEIGETESKIKSVVEWQSETNSTVSRIEQTADENSGRIALVVGQNGIVNESGAVQGSVIVEAINGESSAKIAADRIELEGKKLDIKVDATNIEGEITADQINADGLEVKDARITGDIIIRSMLLDDCAIVAQSDEGASVKERIPVTHILSGMPATLEITAEKPVPQDATVTFVADGNVYTRIIPQGETKITVSLGYVGYVSPPYYAYIYEEDTFMTVSKGIMPYSSGELRLGAPNHVWKELYAESSTINTSDEREKNSISEIPQKYSDMFYKLEPVIYKMNNGTSDRFHAGFVAQSVEKAMSDCGISDKDFAGLIKSPIGDDYKYGLRYSEFIALAVLEIQKLNKRITELEERIK